MVVGQPAVDDLIQQLLQQSAHLGTGADPGVHDVHTTDVQLRHRITARSGQCLHPLLEGLYICPALRHPRGGGVGVQIGEFQQAQPLQKYRPVPAETAQDGRVLGRQRCVVDGNE